MDLAFIIIMGLVLSHAMKQQGTWRTLDGVGDYIGWGVACMFLLAFVRLPIYLIVYGFRFPYHATDNVQFLSGHIAIAFWWSMIYWQLPSRTFNFIFKKS